MSELADQQTQTAGDHSGHRRGLLALLTQTDIVNISAPASLQHRDRSKVLLPAGSSHIVFLLKGVVLDCELIGSEWIASEAFTSGDLIGSPDPVARQGRQRLRKAVADTTVSYLLLFYKDFSNVLYEHPEIASRIAGYFEERSQRASTNVAAASVLAPVQRLAQTLLDLNDKYRAAQWHQPREIPMDLTHLAGLTGFAREGISELLGALEGRGAAALKNSCASILDEEKLRTVADDGL